MVGCLVVMLEFLVLMRVGDAGYLGVEAWLRKRIYRTRGGNEQQQLQKRKEAIQPTQCEAKTMKNGSKNRVPTQIIATEAIVPNALHSDHRQLTL